MTGDSTDSMLIEGLLFEVFGLIDKPINRLAPTALIQQAIDCYRSAKRSQSCGEYLSIRGYVWRGACQA